MLGRKKMREIAERALSLSAAEQTEVLIMSGDSGLTRFANSYIHQNVAERNVGLRVRAVVGKRIGVASCNDLSQGVLERVVESALTIAKLQPENPDFISLPNPAPIAEVQAFDEATAAFSPQARAKAVGVICQLAVGNGLIASGAFTTGGFELTVANSLGIFAYYATTSADINTVIMSDDSAGYAAATAWRVGEINTEAISSEAVEKALRSRHPRELPPGRYPVILEEYAVADMMSTLAYLGFGALSVQEGRSFMTDRFGEQIMNPTISIWDDGLDSTGLPMPFDFEGVPRQRVDLIKEGVAAAVVYDSYTAGREGKASTGHGLPAPNTFGPIPTHMFMAPGEASKEEMLASIERGLWVTRFHYTRPVHPKLAIITGMTRDGTFLIEKGEMAYPIKNLRFTQSYIEALANVEQVCRETRLVENWFGATRIPALKVAEVEFTGATEF
jgi:predicted Zn-dependent protease